MGRLLKRIWNNITGMIHGFLDKVESPDQQLNVFVTELNSEIEKLTGSVARAIADEKRLKLQVDGLFKKADEWKKKAIFAIKEGQDDLAKQALLKKEELESEANLTHKNWETQKQATASLKVALSGARGKADDAKRKYNLLLAQYQSAKTKKQISQTMADLSPASPVSVVDHLEQKILKLEAEADAALEMSGDAGRDDLEAKFSQLENRHRGDEALEELKRRLLEDQDGLKNRPRLEEQKEQLRG